MSDRSIRSFTLVELLIVIAILAVLAAAVVIVLNPAELLAQARDSQRVTDLKNIKKSIDLFVVDNPTVSLGTEERVYISLPDTASNCPNLTSSLPTLPSGWQYVCATSANLRNTNGSGWIPVNFGSVFGGSPIPYLPIDPSNDLASGKYYTYVMGGSYELTALMEAAKENVSVNDGGSLPGVFQVGTHIDLTPPTRDKGLVGYWSLDGALGSITNGQTAGLKDSSGKGNNGTASNANATGMAFVIGQVGNAVQFDGADDYIESFVTSENLITNNGPVTISFWTNITNYPALHAAKTEFVGCNEYHTQSKGGGVGVGINETGIITMIGDTSSTSEYAYSSSNFPISQWTLISMTYDSGTVKMFKNGNFLGSSPRLSWKTNTNPFRIGRGTQGGWNSYSLSGIIDDVRVYSRALSDVEIKSIYEATK